jgi:hypothetical protein
LHAVAQPLSILRASLGNDHLDQMTKDELLELASNSAVQVERACRLFSCLQQLLNIESNEPHLSETAILPVLAQVADGENLLFEESGMLLNVVLPATCPPVLINPARTLEALSTILLIAHAISDRQDTIELIASSSVTNDVRVVVQNARGSIRSMNAEQRLNMALAEANMRSQQANFSSSKKPFRVQIEFSALPLAR